MDPEKITEDPSPTGQPVHTDRPTPIIRTFSSDLADAVKHNEMSVIKVAMAEQKHREQEAEQLSPASATNKRYIILGFVIVVVAALGVLFVYNTKSNKTPVVVTPIETKIQSLIPADATTSIEIGGQSDTDVTSLIQTAIANVTTRDSGIVDIYLTDSSSGTKKTIDVTRFFTSIKSQIPLALLRTLNTRFMLGVIESGGNHPFIILKTNDYETAFAAMFTWERKLYSDFFVPLSLKGGAVFDKKWSDLLVENKDTRVLLSDKNDVALLYSFIDEHTIVIADTVATFKEVRKRLETVRPQ